MKRTLKILAIVGVIATVGAVGQVDGQLPVVKASSRSAVRHEGGNAGVVLSGAGRYRTGVGNLVGPRSGESPRGRPDQRRLHSRSTVTASSTGPANPGAFIGVGQRQSDGRPGHRRPTGGLDLDRGGYSAARERSWPPAGSASAASANWALRSPMAARIRTALTALWATPVTPATTISIPISSGADRVVPPTTPWWTLPMGVLLTEANNKYFAIAFFSSAFRDHNPNDIFDKGYDMGAIVNGDPNPAAPSGEQQHRSVAANPAAGHLGGDRPGRRQDPVFQLAADPRHPR